MLSTSAFTTQYNTFYVVCLIHTKTEVSKQEMWFNVSTTSWLGAVIFWSLQCLC